MHVDEVRDLTCAEVKIRLGSLVLHLGARLPSGLTEWRVFIDSAWRLDRSGEALAGSGDCDDQSEDPAERRDLGASLRLLIGTTLRSVETGGFAGDLTLAFSGGLRLSTFSDKVEGFGWEVRHASGSRITQGSLGQIREWTARPEWEV